MGVPPRGRCGQGVPMCPSPFNRTTINWALGDARKNTYLYNGVADPPRFFAENLVL